MKDSIIISKLLILMAVTIFVGFTCFALPKLTIQNGDLVTVSSGERIYVRVAGHGPKLVVLIPGNNCSGQCFEPILSFVRSIDKYDDEYTFYAFDYRGSGKSTYHAKIASLGDFASDFNDIIQRDVTLSKGNITLVGYSMGFGVAQKMMSLDNSKYSKVISLNGIGTRGIQVIFDASSAGTDPISGKSYVGGDWVDSLSSTAFQQRSWQGKNRTYVNIKFVWDLVVYNDVLKYDIGKFCPTDATFMQDPAHDDSIRDVLSIEYMPESLLYCHFFNTTATPITHTNSNGDSVIILGTNEITAFKGKDVLLLKTKSDYANWRGDLVINDSITQNTKYDLKQAGARVTAVIIKPDEGYDHGFPISHPLQTLEMICKFIETPGELTTSEIDPILGKGKYTIYPCAETDWEMAKYGGF
ncbi:MAG: alpha/beta hydrolase [Thermotogae bacterium]|nr:alpha/beta hydrolase [Thermotogota bacterium]